MWITVLAFIGKALASAAAKEAARVAVAEALAAARARWIAWRDRRRHLALTGRSESERREGED